MNNEPHHRASSIPSMTSRPVKKELWIFRKPFFWLYVLAVLPTPIIGEFFYIGNIFYNWGGVVLGLALTMALAYLAAVLFRKAQTEIQARDILMGQPDNLLWPWPKPAVGLLVLVLVELSVAIPLFSYTFFPCRGVDLIRKVNGCLRYQPIEPGVLEMATAGDGRSVATLDFNGQLRLWSYPDLTPLPGLNSNQPRLEKIALSFDGEALAVCYKSKVNLNETSTGKVSQVLKLPEGSDCRQVLFSPDDRLLVSATEKEIQVWNVGTGVLQNMRPLEQVKEFALSANGQVLAGLSWQGSAYLFNFPALDEIMRIPDQKPRASSLALSRDGQLLYTVQVQRAEQYEDRFSSISQISVWNIRDGSLQKTIRMPGTILTNLFSSPMDGRFAAGNELCNQSGHLFLSKPCVYVWRSISDPKPMEIQAPDEPEAAAFSPFDRGLLIGSFHNLFVWHMP